LQHRESLFQVKRLKRDCAIGQITSR
jgi:hypothetical protein